MKLTFVNCWQKKIKRCNTITSILNTSLTTSTAITGGDSTTTFASGINLPVRIALSGTSLICLLRLLLNENRLKNLL